MDNQTVFYILGIALTALALVVSFLGIRSERFPPSTAVLSGIVVVFVGLIGATAVYAIAAAKDEQEHREAEEAAEHGAEKEATAEAPGEGEAVAEAEQEIESPAPDEIPGGEQAKPAAGGKKPAAGGKKPAKKPAAAGATTLELAADPTQLAFDETSLSAPPGEVTINLDNPAAIPHNVAVASDGDVIAESDTVTESETSLSAQLDPGGYDFLCTVPGHAEAGMQGTLTVK